jgi:hypothetical protein
MSSNWLLDISFCVLLGILTGFAVLPFAGVKDVYTTDWLGLAFVVFNTAAFSGVAAMQWGDRHALSPQSPLSFYLGRRDLMIKDTPG